MTEADNDLKLSILNAPINQSELHALSVTCVEGAFAGEPELVKGQTLTCYYGLPVGPAAHYDELRRRLDYGGRS